MNEAKSITAKLIISIVVPLIIVTFGGLIIYQTPAAFFYPAVNQANAESNGPAVTYYALTLVIALMFFFMRHGFKLYEVIAIGAMSVVYSLSLKRMTPGIFRPIYLFLVPILIFFLLAWLVMKYIFLNQHVRSIRLILFALLNSVAFTFAFWLQYIMIGYNVDNAFLQSRFVSGLMLFIFIGFGLSVAEFIIIKSLEKAKLNSLVNRIDTKEESVEDDKND